MKYIFLIIIAFLLVQEIPAQVRLSTMDSVTSFQPTDLFWLNTKPSSSFLNRKVSWSYLRSNMIDYIDGLANTWALRQTFNGGTFGSAPNGQLIAQDSVNFVSAYPFLVNYIDRTVASSRIGTTASPFLAVYAKNFIIPNAGGTDSVVIGLNDNEDAVKIIGNVQVDIDSAVVSNIVLTQSTYSVANIGDSIITFADTATSLILLATPGDVTSPGISKIEHAYAPLGQEITIFNTSSTDTVLFKQYSAGDDNLFLAGNFYMGQNDVLVIQRVGILPGVAWIEKSRSTNVNAP